jgi:hypothetical protein
VQSTCKTPIPWRKPQSSSRTSYYTLHSTLPRLYTRYHQYANSTTITTPPRSALPQPALKARPPPPPPQTTSQNHKALPITPQGLNGLPSSNSTKNHSASLVLSSCPLLSCALASKPQASLSSHPSPLFVKLCSKKYARSLAASLV